MSTIKIPAYVIQGVSAILKSANLSESHQARVIDAIRKGPRISLPELAKLKNVHRCTIWKLIAAGKIPRPRKDGRRLNTWDWTEVEHIMH